MGSTGLDATVKIKVLVADQEPLVREALSRLIGELHPPAVVNEADSLDTAQRFAAINPDLAVAILDVVLPDASGVDAVHRVRQANPAVRVLIFSSEDNPETARAVLEAGARGFISKRSPTRVLAAAIQHVLTEGAHGTPQTTLC